MLSSQNPTKTNSWKALNSHQRELSTIQLNSEFKNNPLRYSDLSFQFNDILFDFSKNLVNKDTIALLEELFIECKVRESIMAMFTGEKINETEGRSVLHVALRDFSSSSFKIDGQDIIAPIQKVLKKMKDFSERINSGEWKSYSGQRITDIVNIGIGGSDLGPQMVYDALKPYHTANLKCHFVSNVDGAHIAETLRELNPETTLFIIASKTFTTQETMTNAESAKRWFLKGGGSQIDVAKHFVAVSTNKKQVVEFGIDPNNMFEFWDWVGGRYSLWSSIGLSLTCGLGFENFKELLMGAHEMDLHFKNTSFRSNIPLLMAAIGIWYTNFLGATSEAIIPYDQNMHRFAAYFQQANMESNGKSIDRDGNAIDYSTGPIVWGEPGTNGQHAFFQLLHQGKHLIPIDFIGFKKSHYKDSDHHLKLISNLIAQSEALMKGKSKAEVSKELLSQGLEPKAVEKLVPFKVFDGNKPSTVILGSISDPKTLGSLVAAYEHKIFAQGVIWNIFSFDQWGVELGKALAKTILSELAEAKITEDHDSSTLNLMKSLLSEE